MADISNLARMLAGIPRGVDLTTNTLVMSSLKVGGLTPTELTKAILDNLINLQNGSDFSTGTNSHTHDGRYKTITQLASTTGGSSGAKQIGVALSATNYTAATQDVEAHLTGINSALGTAANALDGTFRIKNTADNTKQLAFSVSGLTTATTRTLTMPDANVDLGNLTNANIAAGAAIVYSKLSLSNSIVNADIGASAAIARTKLAALTASRVMVTDGSGFDSVSTVTAATLAFLDATSSVQTQINSKLATAGGTVTGAIDMGANKITSTYVPVNAADLTNKTYVDNAVAGLTWKNAVRAASTANVSVSSAPASVDGVTLASGDRILLKNQTAPAENGIYTFSAAASPLTRATDMDAWLEVVGSVLLSIEGTTNAGAKWVNTNVVGGTLGTTAITFTAFSVAGTVNGTGTAGQNAYWTGTATLAGENFTATVRGGLGADASAFTGVLKFAAGVASASTIVNADVAAGAAIAYSKLALSSSIVNADIAAGAAIAYAKLNLATSIVNGDIAAGAAIAYSKLALSASIVNADISASAAIVYSKLSLTNSIVNADIAAAAAIAYSKLNLSNSIVAGDLTASSVTSAKVATGVFDQVTITGGAGTAAAVAYAPKVKMTFVAGEAFAANTSFAVRIALTGETAGRVYKADYDATTTNKFYVIGMVEGNGAAAISAGQSITVVLMGSITLGSSDTAFGATKVGEPVHLKASGAFDSVSNITYATNQASYRMGMIQDTSTILVGGMQLLGIN